MNKSSRLIWALTFIITAAGLFLPLWPLVVLGILIASLSGHWFFGAIMGILVDLAWGAPAGVLHYLYFPFTLEALMGGVAHTLLSGYFLDRTPPDTL